MGAIMAKLGNISIEVGFDPEKVERAQADYIAALQRATARLHRDLQRAMILGPSNSALKPALRKQVPISL